MVVVMITAAVHDHTQVNPCQQGSQVEVPQGKLTQHMWLSDNVWIKPSQHALQHAAFEVEFYWTACSTPRYKETPQLWQ